MKQFIEPKTFDNRMDSFHLHPFFFSPMAVAEFFFHLEGWKDVEIPEDLIIQLWLTLISFLGCHGSKSNVLLSWMCQFDFSLQEPKSSKDRLNIHIFLASKSKSKVRSNTTFSVFTQNRDLWCSYGIHFVCSVGMINVNHLGSNGGLFDTS